jgi:pimeloyl-ACP methyl ester carboxylesterase
MVAYRPHYRLLASEISTPRAWLMLAHGLLGSGDNWATLARQLVDRRGDWGVVLVDLRMHGQSTGAPPPHTIAAAAGDLVDLSAGLESDGMPVRAVAGHSLGGKVALALRSVNRLSLLQTWVFDASPGICPDCAVDPGNPVVRVLAALETLPESHARRQDFVDAVVGRGFPLMVARWLAKNLVRAEGGYRFGRDLNAMLALLEDYYARDLWVDAGEIGRGETLHFVVAGASQVVDAAARERLRWVEAETAGQLRVHVLEGASHWLHIDAREALLEIVASELPSVTE